jgi:rSAM/selenodomain-associated transferase 1
MSLEPSLANLAIVDRGPTLSRQNERSRASRAAPTRATGNAVLLFLKAPRPGFVKTRLAASVGNQRAVELHGAFAADLLEWLALLRGVERRIVFAPSDGKRECARLLPAGTANKFLWEPQAPGDLGERLTAAFAASFAAGARCVVAIGADAPLLGPGLVRRALRVLRRRDAVLGPAADGGYYLIGLGREAPGVFEGIPWSTPAVLGETLGRIGSGKLSHELLPLLGDVDTGPDLVRLQEELLERWRHPGSAPFPVRTFRALAWMDNRPLRVRATTGRR